MVSPTDMFDTPIRVPKDELDAVGGDDKQLVASLDAVVIVDSEDKISKAKTLDSLQGIHYNFEATDSLVYHACIRDIIQSQLGQPVTLRRLNQLARDIILRYRSSKQPIIDVVIPEQRITGGTVHLVVKESRIGTVFVEPGCYFDCDAVSRWICSTRPGDRIFEPHIENDLFWLNQNRFRRVAVDFEKGSVDGTTDVYYKVTDSLPLQGYMGVDDTGVASLGYGRFFSGFTYGNFLRNEGVLGYQYTTDDQFSRLKAHSLSYSQPISRQWSFQSFGSWAAVTPEMVLLGLSQQGESWQLGASVIRHLVRHARESRSVTLGVDFKSTNNNLEFAGSTVAASTADLFQLRGAYDWLSIGAQQDEYSRVHAEAVVGPGGGLTGAHSAAAFNSIRPGASPDYIYARLRADHSKLLPGGWHWMTRFAAQTSSERMLFSETLGIGGFDTLRGMDQRSYNADHGWIANLELGPRTKRWGCQHSPKSLRAFGFFDFANGYVDDPRAGEDASTFAISTGIGMRFQIGEQLTCRFDYGFGIDADEQLGRNDRGHFSVTWIPGNGL